jgi:hypothetical protein
MYGEANTPLSNITVSALPVDPSSLSDSDFNWRFKELNESHGYSGYPHLIFESNGWSEL